MRDRLRIMAGRRWFTAIDDRGRWLTSLDDRRLGAKFTSLALLLFGMLVFCRYLLSDGAPDRPFPSSVRSAVCSGCFPYVYSNVIRPTLGVCHLADGRVRFFVLVTTVPGERAARDAIRATWARDSRGSSALGLRVIFLLGGGYSEEQQGALLTEASQHGDLLQDDFADNYYNLSLKVLMGYRWVLDNCPQADYVVRSAADNYIDLPRLSLLLQTQGDLLQNAMVGECMEYALPYRWPYHKWSISLKEYAGLFFPPYCVGTTFVTSLAMVRDVVRISSDVPFFPLEDVYFGMCVYQLRDRYRVVDLKGFNIHPVRDRKDALGRCPYPELMYNMHPLEAEQIRQVWTQCRGRSRGLL